MKIQELKPPPPFAIFIFLFVFSLIFPTRLFARSGCCSHHGGVCGCGCCDGTSLSTTCAPYYPQCSQSVYTPIATKVPVIYTPRPTIKAVVTFAPTPTKIPVPSETPMPTSLHEVNGVSVTSTPTPAPLMTGDMIGALAFLAIIIGLPIWIIVKMVKKFRKASP